MAGAALLGRLTWQAAELVEVRPETPRVKTLVFDVAEWPGHRPGQHVDIRLTAEDGYQAERSYSIASASEGRRIELTVERLDDGEVSPYLTNELRPGDTIELRGPIGGYFVWEPPQGGPLLLVAGGSGVVPLMAMIRAREAARSDVKTRLLLSSRGWDDVIYRDELDRLSGNGLAVVHTLTRSQPPGWTGYARRVDAGMLAEVGPSPDERPRVYVCGPTPMMRAVATIADFHGQPCDVSLEQVMGCGLGGCYSCVVLTRQVGAPPHFVRSCLEGPVFDAGRIVWEALVRGGRVDFVLPDLTRYGAGDPLPAGTLLRWSITRILQDFPLTLDHFDYNELSRGWVSYSSNYQSFRR